MSKKHLDIQLNTVNTGVPEEGKLKVVPLKSVNLGEMFNNIAINDDYIRIQLEGIAKEFITEQSSVDKIVHQEADKTVNRIKMELQVEEVQAKPRRGRPKKVTSEEKSDEGMDK